MRIQVAWSPRAGEAIETVVDLAPGATLGNALAAAAVQLDDGAPAGFGIWGRERPLDHPLHEGDRVEVYRPLALDPKEARRQRAAPRHRKPRR